MKREREKSAILIKALHEARVKARPKEVCLWCHKEFFQVQPMHAYCTLECGIEYNRVRKYIMKNTDLKHEDIELERLRKEGKFYEEKSK